MAEEMRSLYLIGGTDAAKIDATRARLRARAEREGGVASLQVFEASEGRGGPDHEALLATLPALSLTESRRYVLADGVERWRDRQLDAVTAVLGNLPPDLTVVLIARAKIPPKLVRAVSEAKGEVHEFEAPKTWDMPRVLVTEAKRLGFRLEPTAGRVLVERMGTNSLRLERELERLALWAGEDGAVTAADLDAMIADTSEAAVWALADALLERDPVAALAIAERLISQGENMTPLIYGLSAQLRKACHVASQLERGVSAQQLESSLSMHPYKARKLIDRLRNKNLAELRQAMEAVADLEVWCRGGADYGDALALTLAVKRAAGPAVAA
jgi:DNA polymerase-3 subunit delta